MISFTGQTLGRPVLRWLIWMGHTARCCCGRVWRSPEPSHCTPSKGRDPHMHTHTLYNSSQMLSNLHHFICAYPLWMCPSCSVARAAIKFWQHDVTHGRASVWNEYSMKGAAAQCLLLCFLLWCGRESLAFEAPVRFKSGKLVKLIWKLISLG